MVPCEEEDLISLQAAFQPTRTIRRLDRVIMDALRIQAEYQKLCEDSVIEIGKRVYGVEGDNVRAMSLIPQVVSEAHFVVATVDFEVSFAPCFISSMRRKTRPFTAGM